MATFDFSKEIELCANISIDWSKFDNKVLMITGATGLMGRFLIQVLLYRNIQKGINTRIIAVGRNREKFVSRFSNIEGQENLEFYKHDVQQPCKFSGRLDMIIHMASNTHPRLYATEPIDTEMTNILGSYHLLQKAAENKGCRFVFVSSGDVYGDNTGTKDFLSETDCGYIDCNTLRAGYIEGKRASEALCNAFKEEKGVDFVTARLCRIYGPTMQTSDSKAISQFINKAVAGESIILKSEGKQTFSYLYVYDAVSALLTISSMGEMGNVYNVADNDQCISLRNLAAILADVSNTSVKMELPDLVESKGSSTFQNVKLDATKLYGLGWKCMVEMEDGLRHTVHSLSKKNKKLSVLKY